MVFGEKIPFYAWNLFFRIWDQNKKKQLGQTIQYYAFTIKLLNDREAWNPW